MIMIFRCIAMGNFGPESAPTRTGDPCVSSLPPSRSSTEKYTEHEGIQPPLQREGRRRETTSRVTFPDEGSSEARCDHGHRRRKMSGMGAYGVMMNTYDVKVEGYLHPDELEKDYQA